MSDTVPQRTVGACAFGCFDGCDYPGQGVTGCIEPTATELFHGVEQLVETATAGIVVVDVEAFAAVREASAEPLIGTDEETVLAAGGTAMVYGEGGAGKTTAEVDLAFHVAAGIDWLNLPVARRARGLILEAEGPRGKMRTKLAAKLAAWEGPNLDGWLHVIESPWATLSLANAEHRAMLAQAITDTDAEIVFAGPVAALGLEGGGTPAEVRAFVAHLEDIRERVGRPVAFVLIAHENKAGQVSGAWEGATDTLAHMHASGHGKCRLVWKKTRWSGALHGTTWHLLWRAGETFELEDKPEVTDADIIDALVAHVGNNPGTSWRAVENDPSTTGNGNRMRELRDRLLQSGQLVNVPNGRAMQLYLPDEHELQLLCPDPDTPGTHSVSGTGDDRKAAGVSRVPPIGDTEGTHTPQGAPNTHNGDAP